MFNDWCTDKSDVGSNSKDTEQDMNPGIVSDIETISKETLREEDESKQGVLEEGFIQENSTTDKNESSSYTLENCVSRMGNLKDQHRDSTITKVRMNKLSESAEIYELEGKKRKYNYFDHKNKVRDSNADQNGIALRRHNSDERYEPIQYLDSDCNIGDSEDARSDNHGMVSPTNVHQESGQKVTISHDWMVEQSLREQQSEGKQFTNIFTEIVIDTAEKANCVLHDIKHKKRAIVKEPYCFPITLRSQCKKEIDTCMSNSDIINIFHRSLAADLVCVPK